MESTSRNLTGPNGEADCAPRRVLDEARGAQAPEGIREVAPARLDELGKRIAVTD